MTDTARAGETEGCEMLPTRSAVLSDCGRYRYRLDRDTGRGMATAAGFMVNPSKADGTIDDQTIRKWSGFAERNGIGRFIIGNKFAYRATDVRELRHAADPIGPENDSHIERIMREADIHIVAWGPLAKLPPRLRGRWRKIVEIAEKVGCQLYCFGTALDGHPRHPLMLSYDTPLVKWRAP